MAAEPQRPNTYIMHRRAHKGARHAQKFRKAPVRQLQVIRILHRLYGTSLRLTQRSVARCCRIRRVDQHPRLVRHTGIHSLRIGPFADSMIGVYDRIGTSPGISPLSSRHIITSFRKIACVAWRQNIHASAKQTVYKKFTVMSASRSQGGDILYVILRS